ncbi:MAG TPA: hypothetical protein VJS64_02360 [Pyrinomonadaceae bacterium]|nr:hypothetical protein [Pyrinomonadaceae bacterium]
MTDNENYEMIGRAVVERRALEAREGDIRRELDGIGRGLEKFGSRLQSLNLSSSVEVTPEVRRIFDIDHLTELLTEIKEIWKRLAVLRDSQ